MKCLELCSIKRQCLLLLNCTEENQILILGTLWLICGMHYFSFSGPRRQLAIPANFFWDIRVRFLSWECWDFWRRHDHSRRSPKASEDVRSLPKTSEVFRRFSFLTWVWVNVFLEIVSSRTATTHIFQSGVSRREIEVFNPQAWELAGIACPQVWLLMHQKQPPIRQLKTNLLQNELIYD